MKRRFLTFILILVWVVAYSHNVGTIKGKIIDSEISEPIPGANILIEQTMLGTISGINGEFEFRNIHVGEYNLVQSLFTFDNFYEATINYNCYNKACYYINNT